MKIAIVSGGETSDSQIYFRSAQAPYFLIFEEGELKKTLENPHAEEERGLGPKVARLLVEEGVDKVVVKQIGPNMEMVLKNNKVEVEKTELEKAEEFFKE